MCYYINMSRISHKLNINNWTISPMAGFTVSYEYANNFIFSRDISNSPKNY